MKTDAELAEALDTAHERAEHLFRHIERLRTADLGTDLEHVRVLIDDIYHPLDRAFCRARRNRADLGCVAAFARGLRIIGARRRVRSLKWDLDRVSDVGRVPSTSDLDKILSRAGHVVAAITNVSGLAEVGSAGVNPSREHPVVRIMVSAVRVTGAAAWLLPPAMRARYTEEYRSELWDLTPAPLWCGDVMVTDTGGGGSPGDLGRATTPGTGFGVVLANLPPDVLTACTTVGGALAGAYTDVALPGGPRGSLVFTSYRRP